MDGLMRWNFYWLEVVESSAVCQIETWRVVFKLQVRKDKLKNSQCFQNDINALLIKPNER